MSQPLTTVSVDSGPTRTVPAVVSRSSVVPELSIQDMDRNPIFGLCLRLATYHVRHGKCVDPKGSGLSRQDRLFRMFGNILPRRVFRSLCLLKRDQWRTIEECWIANMHTVVLHPQFNPLLVDFRLINSIKRYKRWFVCFFCRRKRNGDGLRNLDKGLKALKTIAGHMQYMACSDYPNNRVPPEIPFWPGFHSDSRKQMFPWFGGHLSHFRDLTRQLSDEDLVALCQIRTFGRALPPPSRTMCENDLIEQIKILSTERIVDPVYRNAICVTSQQLSEKLDISTCPSVSHFSLSTSGCLEATSKEGGNARLVRDVWMPYLSAKVDEHTVSGPLGLRGRHKEMNLFDACQAGKLDNLTDCYGNYVFPIDSTGTSGYNSKRVITTVELLYRGAAANRRMLFNRSILVDSFEKSEALPSEVGPALLLLAVGYAYRSGHFVHYDDPDVIAEPDAVLSLKRSGWTDLRIPLWVGYHNLRYKVVKPPKSALTCLAEPGAKTRPLGNNETWFVVITRVMRFMIEPVIARDGRARIGLRSTNKMWSFLKYLQKALRGGQRWCQSTDYKSSTDYIPLDVIKDIWISFTRKMNPRHPFLVFFDLIVSNRNLSLLDFKHLEIKCSPEYSGDDRIDLTHRCGSFMGEPMSFMTLTMINLIIDEISEHLYVHGTLDTLGSAVTLTREPSCICGDDFAALRHSLGRILCFKDVADKVGMVLSWKDQISRRVLIFCEDHVLINQHGKPLYVDVVKSRLLTGMSRQHSDNRSSILGKGRMLRNQLDYFEDPILKREILYVFRSVFDRIYNGSVDHSRLPIWLPPSCGGLGFPVLEEDVPAWGWKYVRYILDILKIENVFEKYLELSRLRTLNSPSKKGIFTWNESLGVLSKIVDRFTIRPYDGVLDNMSIDAFCIYPDQFVIDLVRFTGREVPMDPYDQSKFDWDSLANEAAFLGFIKADQLLEELERILNFQDFLIRGSVRQQRTYDNYCRHARSYFRKAGFSINENTQSVTKADCPEFTTWAKLEKSCLYTITGWISIADPRVNIFNSTASLKLNFRQLRKVRQTPLSGLNVESYVDLVNESLRGTE